MPTVLYSADVVCPMTGPPLSAGGVLVEGDRIVAVGEATALRPDADREHHIDGVLLPGLVNGHTNVELADAVHLARDGPHHAWLAAVGGLVRGWDDERWTRSAHRGVRIALRAGVTALGDGVLHGPAVPALSRAGVLGDSWVEVADADATHTDAVVAAVEHALGLPAEGRRVGIAPAAPYRLGTGVLQALVALAARTGAPLHIRAAQTQAELAALRDGEGPLAEAARDKGLEMEWLDGGTDLTPVRYLDACGALRPSTTLVHGVWVDAREARLLAARGVAVVCTPRANARLSAGPTPLERYAAAGVRLALGTDSAAVVPDGDVLAEAAAWVALAKEREMAFWPSSVGPIPLAEQAVRLATVDGAAALGWGDRAGVLEPGRRADLVGVEIATTAERVYHDLVEQGPGRQVLTVLGGVRKARRASAAEPWPSIDHLEEWRT
ncbi:MAG TPA: amidohydrolase family protein [Egibacteraceae bacterium]